jgi:polyphosphate kinase
MDSIFTARELSWLSFNERVLNESIDPNNPLLEQLRFLSIFSKNLDEFFMIRISGMLSQTKLGLLTPDYKSGLIPSDYLKEMLKESKRLVKNQYKIYKEKVSQINEYVSFVNYNQLSEDNKKEMETYFYEFVYPVLTPIRFSSYLPFPLLTYILLEDLIINHLTLLYPGLQIIEAFPFRITRDFDIEFDSQSDDFAESVMSELKNRKRGAAVRLEIDKSVTSDIIEFLKDHLSLSKKHMFFIDGPIDLTFLEEFYDILKRKYPSLCYPYKSPVDPSIFKNEHVMSVIEKEDVILLHPHHSYDPVIRLVKEASEDESVVAIKQTIYRTNKDSRIMKSLLSAAENGKQVTVLFELKARFDEENNLFWGNELEKAGAHVIYGVPNLKTHSKLLLIIKRTESGVKEYCHISTGNYNEINAKLYTDVSYFTTDKEIGKDLVAFFNYISSFAEKPTFNKLIASPNSIRDMLKEKIDKEIENQEAFGNGRIILKINSITDIDMIKQLSKASKAGVKIDLIVRGICCLVPGIPGKTDNIRVHSLVGRYLEHMRVYYFYNDGNKDIYISSADLMTRNMVNRIEIAMPIVDEQAKSLLYKVLELQLLDNVKSYENILNDYKRSTHNDSTKVNSQEDLFKIIM